MDVIKKQRAVLKDKKVRLLFLYVFYCVTMMSSLIMQKSGEDVQRTRRKYLDFIDILLEARVY